MTKSKSDSAISGYVLSRSTKAVVFLSCLYSFSVSEVSHPIVVLNFVPLKMKKACTAMVFSSTKWTMCIG